MKIYSVKTFGCMTVYERDRKGDTSVPKYFVMNKDTGRILEEFRRKDRAMKWAERNAFQGSAKRSVNDILQELIDHPDVKDLGMSIILDDAPDWPIVLTRTTEEMVEAGEDARAEGDPPYLFKVGQVRFEVSDGLPNHRGDSFDHTDFNEAVGAALEWQGKCDARKVRVRG